MRVSSHNISTPSLNGIGEKGFPRDYVLAKGPFIMLGVVGIVGIWISEINDIPIDLWLISLD